MEVGKALKKTWGPFFFFFLLFTFENDRNLFWVYQNGKFSTGKKHSRREKNQEKWLCPLRKICLLRPCIAIQETWFTEDTWLEYYNLPNCSLETINRIDCNVGGVGIYISNDIDSKVRTDINSQNENFESCFIEINRSNDKNIIIGSIYRHYHHSIHEFNNHLEDVVKKI